MSITISTLDCSEEIKRLLNQEKDFLDGDSMGFIFDEDKQKDITLFEIDLKKDDNENNTNKYIADIIAAVVLNNLEEKIIKKIVNHKFNKFTDQEKEKIIGLALSQLKSSIGRSKKIEKNMIAREVLKYLKNNHDFNLEGFVRFRLKEYMHHIHLAINQAADDIILEKEYDEFIDLLQYFVSLQEIKISSVHVYEKEDGSYEILDKDDKILDSDLIENYVNELLDEDITYEDILISSLINLSPGLIFVHFEDDELLDTLENIFENKIQVDFS